MISDKYKSFALHLGTRTRIKNIYLLLRKYSLTTYSKAGQLQEDTIGCVL
jgi:hypothetical protein